jgi:hypothetical protein
MTCCKKRLNFPRNGKTLGDKRNKIVYDPLVYNKDANKMMAMRVVSRPLMGLKKEHMPLDLDDYHKRK